MANKTEEMAERLKKPFSRMMTEEELEFCRDVQATIDFAIRNGLSFGTLVSALNNDVNEIARNGFNLRQAKSRGFVPMVSGYSKFSAGEFGEVEEPTELKTL